MPKPEPKKATKKRFLYSALNEKTGLRTLQILRDSTTSRVPFHFFKGTKKQLKEMSADEVIEAFKSSGVFFKKGVDWNPATEEMRMKVLGAIDFLEGKKSFIGKGLEILKQHRYAKGFRDLHDTITRKKEVILEVNFPVGILLLKVTLLPTKKGEQEFLVKPHAMGHNIRPRVRGYTHSTESFSRTVLENILKKGFEGSTDKVGRISPIQLASNMIVRFKRGKVPGWT